jgi:CRP/FNR family transcriptional regulator
MAKSPKLDRLAALQSTQLFGGLASEALVDIAKRAIELHIKKGEILFLSGEPARGLFVLVSGKIRTFQQNEDGRELVLQVDADGSVLGDVPVFDDGPYPASAIAEIESEVLLIERSDVRKLCVQYPLLALAALKLMAEKVRRHANLVEAVSLHEVGQRLALFLLAEAQSSEGIHNAFPLRLSNHEIASRIGSVRDVVSRALGRLKHMGLISVDDRDVTILDLAGLEQYASKHGS